MWLWRELTRRWGTLRKHARTSGTERSPSGGAMIEPMEPRQMLSAVSKAVPWPNAPFNTRLTTIYVNQFGYAELPSQTLKASTANRYRVYFDDPGTVIAETTGALRTQLAYYDGPGSPKKITPGRPRGGAIIEGIVHSKQTYFLSVRGRDGAHQGRYGLYINGVKHNVIRNLPIRAQTQAGTFQTNISNPGDCDFYEFTVGKTGRWQVSVEPRDYLDAMLMVFDADGNPVGGTYTRPINAGGEGVAESWTAPKLIAGEQYFVRVDGKGESLGFYQVRAQLLRPPMLSINTVERFASEDGTPGSFIISRSSRSSIAEPLRVNYMVLGSATNGVDYQPLSGVATIPAGSRSARITVTPIADDLVEGEESVGLVLLDGKGYTLAAKRMASLVITDTTPTPALAS